MIISINSVSISIISISAAFYLHHILITTTTNSKEDLSGEKTDDGQEEAQPI